jgi:TolB-like protein/Flp pilus assembly protein TadD
MESGSSFASRLGERKLVQWALAYLAGAWAVLEVLGYVGDQFGWPALVGQVLIVFALFGFCIALVLAWFHGEKGRQRVSGPELVLVITLLLAAGVAAALLRSRAAEAEGGSIAMATSPLPGDDRPSVAVLPFLNLSADPDDAYLADGIHDEVLMELAKVGGLRVISRTSVMRYKASQQNLRQIGSELGAGFILEATFQRIRDRLRVTAQLIRAAQDEHVWAESFDEEFSLDNVLDIRTRIACGIAEALQATLTPAEQALVGARHTDNLAAYEAYFLGRYFQHRPHFTVEDLERALAEFTRAVELDSTFAMAWLELANTHAQEVFYWTDASEERRSLARRAADKAMALNPTSPEAHLKLGLFHLWLDRDTDAALRELTLAEEGMPNSQELHEARAVVFEVQGRFEEAVREIKVALTLSPRDPSLFTSLGLYHWVLRQYGPGETYAQQARILAPDQLWPNLTKVLVVWSDRGPTPETEAILETLPHALSWVKWGRFYQRMMEDRYEDALQVLSDPEFGWIQLKMFARPQPLLQALALRALGRDEEADARFREASTLLEVAVADHQGDPRYHSSLGLAYAGMGRCPEATREGERAVTILPVSTDAMYGIPYLVDLADIRAVCGDVTGAVLLMEELLTLPSWISPAFLEGDFLLDGIRQHPRFRELMGKWGDDR